MSSRSLSYFVTALSSLFLLPLGWISYTEITKMVGIRPVRVEVAGTGSMYPSLYWDKSQGGPEDVATTGIEEYRSSPAMYRYFPGITVFGQLHGKAQLSYGDMVAFKSVKTREILSQEGKDPDLGFIKRLIGMPGDTIELRDGYVLRNNEVLDEPYTRSPRSTYGTEYFTECQPITVPPNSYLVLGDNRKASADSRSELGFVADKDIQFYLPLPSQQLYRSLWRDTKNDTQLSHMPTLAATDFYSKLSRLKRQAKLENSAKIRANALLSNLDTPLDMAEAMRQANYQNIVTAEFVIYGHYTADELVSALLANPKTRTQIEHADYTEIGLAAVVGNVRDCPTQVIVGHLGGYIPASYEAEVIESYDQAVRNLAEVIPSWEQGLGQEGVDQTKLTELLTLLRSRYNLLQTVLKLMQQKQWLTPTLRAELEADNARDEHINELTRQLNGE